MLLSVADKVKHVIFIKLLKWYFSWKVRIIFHGCVNHLSFAKNLITVYFTTQNRHSLYSGIHSIPNIACVLLVPIWVKPFKLGSPPL